MQASDPDPLPGPPLDGQARPRRARLAIFFGASADLPERAAPGLAYVWALVICAAVTGVASLLLGHIDLTNLVMLYLLGVIFTAARLGRGPGVLLSFASVAAFDFFFVPPRGSFSVSDTQYLLTFLVMLLTALVISHLTAVLKREAWAATQRERRTAAMYAMARELAAALTNSQIIEIGCRHVREVFQARVTILLPDSGKMRRDIEDPAPAAHPAPGVAPTDFDLDLAQWVYDRQRPAGRGTGTLAASAARYLPLKAPMRTRGVLALAVARPSQLDAPEQQRMLDTFAAQIALALERVHYVAIARDAQVDMESERLRNSLLSVISHDLRTPLTTIVGFASLLAARHRAHLDEPAGASDAELAEAIHEEALRMSGQVTNLLDMARLQAGRVRLNHQWLMLEEVVGAALRACRRQLAGRPTQVRLPADLPLLHLDAVLMERLFANLFDNAAKYTSAGTPLEIGAAPLELDGQPFVRVCVDDHGAGLPGAMTTRIFEKFTRGEKESAQSGVGLGLAICHAIVSAHGGKIGAENRYDGQGAVAGARFWFTLPVSEPPPGPDALADAAAPGPQPSRIPLP